MYFVVFKVVSRIVSNLVLLLNPRVCIFCTFHLLFIDFSSREWVLIYVNYSLPWLAFFLLGFLVFNLCKIFTIGTSSYDIYVWVWDVWSFMTPMVVFLSLRALPLHSFSGDLSLMWFLTRKLSQLCPLLWRWNLTNIFIMPWWYIVLPIYWIFF